MKNLRLVVTAVIACSALAVLAVPVPEPNPDPAPAPAPEPKTDIELMKIPLEGDQELDVITLVDTGDQKINERNKRTIGILRELFPTISQILDQKIQMITSYLFRTIGPILLRSGLGGGAGGGASNRGTTDDDFDADFDDDDDDKADSEKNDSNDGGQKVSISLPTFSPSSDDDDDDKAISSTDSSAGTTSDENEIRKRAAALTATLPSAVSSSSSSSSLSSSSSSLSGSDPTTTALSADTAAPSTITSNDSGSSSAELTTTQIAQDSTDLNVITSNQDLNTLESLDLAGLSDTLNAIRKARATDQDVKSVGENDEASDASAKSSALDELSLDSEGNDEDRNKRFLFGGSSGGAGGSGNFLFDIIRQTADRAARAAGTVYRVVAGTESLTNDNKNNNNNNNNKNDEGRLSTTTKTTSSHSSFSSSHSALVSGSSGTEQGDEKANSPEDDHELGKGDGYTEGIPGPVTRLFVLANRGLSNLIQDLILRIAQTSERVVNFKARLITSLI